MDHDRPDLVPERRRWELHEIRKRDLAAQVFDPDDYDRACQALARELGL